MKPLNIHTKPWRYQRISWGEHGYTTISYYMDPTRSCFRPVFWRGSYYHWPDLKRKLEKIGEGFLAG